jgi:hypothetical protein
MPVCNRKVKRFIVPLHFGRVGFEFFELEFSKIVLSSESIYLRGVQLHHTGIDVRI